jgi:arylsulfatase A-like enzyme
VILIVSDTFRFDHLGCYGNEWIKTPNIDNLASEGTIFCNAYSEGLPTLPTRTTLYTGRYTFPFRGWQGLESNDTILSEILWNKGFTTALISDTYHAHKPGMGFGRGFDYVKWIRGQCDDPYIIDRNIKVNLDKYSEKSWKGGEKPMGWSPKAFLEQFLRNTANWSGEDDTFVAQVVKCGIQWLKQQSKKERNFFFLLDSFDPHAPWNPPFPYNKMYSNEKFQEKPIIMPIPGKVEGYLTEDELANIRALYAGEISLVDKWIGIFLKEVKNLGLMDNTLIIFLSDHGDFFGNGKWGHGIVMKSRNWLYEELIHIPLIIRHPKGLGKNMKISSLVETCDVMPTILDFLNVPCPKKMHGESLIPLILGEKKNIRKYSFSGYYNSSWSIRDNEWKYILQLNKKSESELYNLVKDPHEQNNLLKEKTKIANSLELQLRKFVTQLKSKQ